MEILDLQVDNPNHKELPPDSLASDTDSYIFQLMETANKGRDHRCLHTW
jgi:hypothetical protein